MTKLQVWNGAVVLALAWGVGGATVVRAQTPVLEEMPVKKVFFPATGYDDNDNVQVIIAGPLPDACYVVAEHRIELNPVTHAFTLRQFAWRRHEGFCEGGDQLPGSDFSEEFSLGELKSGDYKINGQALHIDVAKAPSRDDYLYARTTSLEHRFIPAAVLPEGTRGRAFRIRSRASSIREKISWRR